MVFNMMQTPANNALNKIHLNITEYPISYYSQGKILFSYIYITNVFSAAKQASLFQGIDQKYYAYLLNYNEFMYTAGDGYLFMAVKNYSSTDLPFMKLTTYKDFSNFGSTPETFIIGYWDNTGNLNYTADVLMINTTAGSCAED